jgi:hypothetical protein
MTTPRTILRDSALALPLLAGLGGWLEGVWGATGVFASGLVTLLNLALLAWLVDRIVRATAAGNGGGGAIALVFGKMLFVLGAYGALLSVFPALSVALGLGAGIVGLTVRAVADTLHVPSGETPAEDA